MAVGALTRKRGKPFHSIRGAPSAKAERPQSGVGDRCVVTGPLRLLCFASPLRPAVGVLFVATQRQQLQAEDIDAARKKAARKYTSGGRAPPAQLACDETC
jgi:hypothetical protein